MINKKEAYSILYIEDEKDIRANYVNYLDRHFEKVYEAADGEEGYEKYKKNKPDIMIVDINLPKLSGLDLVRKIRENDHSSKVIMLTAHFDTKYMLEATELKLTKYLVKPVSRSELKDALNLAIDELSNFETRSKKTVVLKDGFYWDIQREELLNNNSSAVLTNKERSILSLLFSSINTTFTYDDIIMNVWYEESYDRDKLDALKTIIKNLRKKLPKDTIKNVFGWGYKIEQ
ncbi:two-component response regulator [Sulfurimonas gotlandica GD1]|uniref:Two-component response regulator n=1 Tax=Sulfurimonas gotlandica (strain DSM 19862 / JCM 16533 / GD1) TaxID=929558 RepID=B6BKU8_SULGG|nr:response regulator transcription factor [Sulfurimonas gotlandica]EDZ62285.1 two component transcriptional regulator, winged helix family [Sulfurimonas gotlandica GD1]EHP29159.1 two-component response regulator [Sulfurimonas gotlandica GD1]